MKNTIIYGLFAITITCLIHVMHPMDQEFNNNERKRARDENNIEETDNVPKTRKLSMTDEDWNNALALLNVDAESVSEENQENFIKCYLEKIYNDGDIEYAALLALLNHAQKIIEAIKKYENNK